MQRLLPGAGSAHHPTVRMDEIEAALRAGARVVGHLPGMIPGGGPPGLPGGSVSVLGDGDRIAARARPSR